MSVLLCLANLLLCVTGLVRALRDKSMTALFWLCAIGLAAYPMAMDSLLVASGGVGWLVDAYYDFADGAPPYVDEQILSRAAAFNLAFNGLFWLAAAVVLRGCSFKQGSPTSGSSRDIGDLERLLAFGGWASVCYMVFVEYGGLAAALNRPFQEYGFREIGIGVKNRYLHNLASSLILVSGYGLWYAVRARSLRRVLAAAGPNLAMSLVTSQRPWLVALSGSLLAGILRDGWLLRWRQTGPRVKLRRPYLVRVGSVGAILLAFVFLLNFVRTYRLELAPGRAEAVWNAVRLAGYQSAFLRDPSVFVMYWVFENIPDRLHTTGGVTSGDIARTLLHLPRGEVDPIELAGFHIAWYRNRQTLTTLHPTFYGWSMADLSGWGALWGAVFGVMVSGLERVTRRSDKLLFAISGPLAVLIVVAMRGSVPYAIFKAFYGVLVAGLAVWAENRLAGGRVALWSRAP